ncbi:MAG TPA: hypothetical protein PKD10_01980 [Paracoccaceae bacterium]|nr:hypothetical protein [Paracoccaceae bacterium]HMO73001.1 hypothetical protein [Paracoccaceae bacterium]
MADNLHSTLVAWLKVILPLVALAMLSTLFLVARRIDPEAAIPFAEAELEDRLRQPRLTGPIWSGVTDDGAALRITASEARPASAGNDTPTARDLAARFDMPDGGQADIAADRGTLDTAAGTLTVDGNVLITTSAGYRVETPALVAALDRTRVESRGAVTAEGPIGRIEAQGMALTASEDDPGTYVLRFTGGVKLLYRQPDDLP